MKAGRIVSFLKPTKSCFGMCLSRAPPPRAWRGVGGLIPKWRTCIEHIRFSCCFLKLRTNQLYILGVDALVVVQDMVFFHDFWEISYPASMGGFCVYPRTGPVFQRCFNSGRQLPTPPRIVGGVLGLVQRIWGSPRNQVPRKVGPFSPIVIHGVSQMADTWDTWGDISPCL